MLAHLRLTLLLPLALLMAGAAIGTLTAYDPALSLPLTASLWVGGLLYLAIVAFCRDKLWHRRLAGVLVLLAALGALFCFAQYRHFGFERKIELIARVGELTSAPFPFFLNIPFQQNMAAAFLEGALPLALGLWASSGGRARHLWLGAAALIGAGVVLTVSRGAWAALAACAVVAAVAALGKRRPRVALGLIGGSAALAAIAVLALLSPWGRELAGGLVERAASRLSLYSTALPLAFDTAFTGIGPGDTFAMIYSRYALLIQVPYLTYAHNLPLAIWFGAGLLGAAGLVGMLIGAGRLFWRAGSVGTGPLWLGAALGSLALLLHGLVDAPQYNGGWYSMLMAWAILGLAVAAARMSLPVPDQRTPFSLHPAAFILAPIAITLAALFLWRPIAAQAAVNFGAVAEARADLGPQRSDAERATGRAEAVVWYNQALALNPGHSPAARRLGLHTLNAGHYAEALSLLEIAHQADPRSETVRKALGYAALWSGQVERAATLFDGLERRAELRGELDAYSWWWANEGGRPDLSAHAAAAARMMDSKPGASTP